MRPKTVTVVHQPNTLFEALQLCTKNQLEKSQQCLSMSELDEIVNSKNIRRGGRARNKLKQANGRGIEPAQVRWWTKTPLVVLSPPCSC